MTEYHVGCGFAGPDYWNGHRGEPVQKMYMLIPDAEGDAE